MDTIGKFELEKNIRAWSKWNCIVSAVKLDPSTDGACTIN